MKLELNKSTKVMLGVSAAILLVLISFTAGAVASENLPWANKIYQIERAIVWVFDDQDNKCYVVDRAFPDSRNSSSISCVKRGQPE